MSSKKKRLAPDEEVEDTSRKTWNGYYPRLTKTLKEKERREERKQKQRKWESN